MTFDDVTAADWGEKIATRYDAFYGTHGNPHGLASFLLDYVGDGEIIEVGVGTGNVGAALARASGRRIVGVDISPALLDEAARTYGAESIEPVLLDVAQQPLDRPFSLAYAVFNTLFMVGDVARQDAALVNLRASAEPGARLVLENFEPVGKFFEEDSFTSLPLDMSGTEVMVRFTRVHAARRRVEGQDVYFGPDGCTLAPCLFHYRLGDEVAVACVERGWRLVERFEDWRRKPFAPADSTNSIAVYEAV